MGDWRGWAAHCKVLHQCSSLGWGAGKWLSRSSCSVPLSVICSASNSSSRATSSARRQAALQRLAATLPDVYSVRSRTPGESIRVECDGGRRIEFRCADFFTLGLNLCERSDAIVFAVNVPCKGFPELCRRFAQAKEGCRLLTYHALDTIWWSSEPCPFHQVEANVPESDTFSTSWSPQGYRFYVYVADRRRCPAIDSSVRNETYTQWQAVWDEASNAHYYHNQETEISQWEVPTHAGGWEAVWSEEHDAYFFWHGPSGHSQWAAPRCLADLSWGAS